MRFSKPFVFEVYVMSDEEIEMDKQGLDLPEMSYEGPTEKRYFYSVDVIGPSIIDERMSVLYVGTDSFNIKGRLKTPLNELTCILKNAN